MISNIFYNISFVDNLLII